MTMRPPQKVKKQIDPVHSIWRTVRGPFRVIQCNGHEWERYDIQRAGCLKCGCQHRCRDHLFESECSLVRLDDCSTCCTITGFCIPTVRYSDNEYIENITYAPVKEAGRHTKVVFDEVLSLVKWFLTSNFSVSCKKNEVNKILARVHVTSLKLLKQQKAKCLLIGQPPCFLTAFAQTMHHMKMKSFCRASHQLCMFCATHITQCLNNLQLVNVHNRKSNLVLGMLYLMKQGLVIQNTQWLPRTPELASCLPHETNLDKVYKLSMKLVCETENEIKLALRHKVKLV